MLIGLAACVFTSTVLSVLLILPAPLDSLDYFVVGAVSVLVALSVPFVAVSVSTRSRGRRHEGRLASSGRDLRT